MSGVLTGMLQAGPRCQGVCRFLRSCCRACRVRRVDPWPPVPSGGWAFILADWCHPRREWRPRQLTSEPRLWRAATSPNAIACASQVLHAAPGTWRYNATGRRNPGSRSSSTASRPMKKCRFGEQDGTAPVHRGQHEVTGQRSLDRDAGHLDISDLAHKDDVGVLAQDRAHPGVEPDARLRVDVDLADSGEHGTPPGAPRQSRCSSLATAISNS